MGAVTNQPTAMPATYVRSLALCLALVFAAGSTCLARAQTPTPGAPPAETDPSRVPAERLPPEEVVRLFDAYAVVQAQDALQLDTEQYGTFVSHYRALLETRRRHQLARWRLLMELNRLTRGPRATRIDEAAVREKLRALEEHDAQGATAIRDALATLEQGLTVVQRARFRVFEEQMERRKLELLSRARMPRGRRMAPPR